MGSSMVLIPIIKSSIRKAHVDPYVYVGQHVTVQCTFPEDVDFEKVLKNVDKKYRLIEMGHSDGAVIIKAVLPTAPSERLLKYLLKKTNNQVIYEINNLFRDIRTYSAHEYAFAYASKIECPSCHKKVSRKKAVTDSETYGDDGDEYYVEACFNCPKCKHTDTNIVYEKPEIP